MNRKKTTIIADKPLMDPKLDKFGYADFAHHLAGSILKMPTIEGLVLALYGQWGSGKTTIINFVTHFLKADKKNEQPIIIRYNPWWFSGDETLFIQFFNQLRTVLKKELVLEEKQRELLGELLDMIADAWSDLPWQAKIALRLVKKGQPKNDVVALKEKIAELLRNQNKKIIIIIDDIDRLTAEEIRQIFRLVKAVADFPNVIYLLAFDKKVAVSALEYIQGISGEEYLEKIVQAPFNVPMPERNQLNNLLVEKLNSVIVDSEKDEKYDQQHWQNMFFEGLEKYFTTPRKVTQLFNALAVTYPPVQGEVNNVDFIAVECIRVFTPAAYEIMRQNPQRFIGHTLRLSLRNDENDMKELAEFHKGWIESLPQEEKEILKHILPVLFPKLRKVFGGYSSETEDETKLRLYNRICDYQSFPIYFRLAVSRDAISSLEMNTLVTLTADKEAFAKRLLELSKQKLSNKTTRLKATLERLRDYSFDRIPKENIQNIVDVCFDTGDKLLVDEDRGQDMFDYGDDVLIGRVLWVLLKRNNKETNFSILKQAIERGNALSVIAREIGVLGQQHGKHSANVDHESEQLLNLEDLEALEQIAAKKIQEEAEKEKLLKTPHLTGVLHRWKDWSGEKEVQEWIKKTIVTDKNLLLLLEKFLSYTISYRASGKMANPRLDPDWFKPFLSVDEIIDRVKELSKNKNLPEKQKIALFQFLKEYEMRAKGKDPSGPFAFDEE